MKATADQIQYEVNRVFMNVAITGNLGDIAKKAEASLLEKGLEVDRKEVETATLETAEIMREDGMILSAGCRT